MAVAERRAPPGIVPGGRAHSVGRARGAGAHGGGAASALAARRRRPWLVRALRGATAVLGSPALRGLQPAARAAVGGCAPLLPLRRDEDPLAAGGDHLRRAHPAELPLDRAHPCPARRQARRRRQHRRGRARCRDAVLLVQRCPRLHRLRSRRGPARRHPQLPDRKPTRERGRRRAPLRNVRLRNRRALHQPGLVLAISAGFILGRMRLERYIEPFVLEAAAAAPARADSSRQSRPGRSGSSSASPR